MKSSADPFDQYIDMNEYKSMGNLLNPTAAPASNMTAPPKLPSSQNTQRNALSDLLKTLGGDISAGLLTGGQNLAATLGETGQWIGQNVLKNGAPTVNIREQLGLGENNPVDFGQMLGGNSGASKLVQGIAQYAPGVAIGGRNLLGQVLSNAGWGASQANTDERGIAALEGGALAAIPFGIGPAARGIKAGYQYLTPSTDAKAFIESLGGGAQTAEENIAQLGKRIKFGYESNKQDALMTKQNVLDTVGNKRLDVLPGLTEEKIAKVFTNDAEQFTEENISELQKALNGYFKNQNIDKFIQKGEDIFGIEGLTTKQANKLDEMLNLKQSNYLSKGKADYLYNHDLKKLHSAFERKPTFQNADNLQSQIGTDIGYFERLKRQGKLEPADKIKLDDLKHARDLLIKDMEGFLDQTSPDLAKEYQLFRNKWRENVVPYSSSDLLRNFTAKNPEGGITSSNIASEFSFPDKYASKVMQDIGQSGKNNVLFNELQKSESFNPKDLAEAISKMKTQKGYQQHISPEQEKLLESLVKRQNTRENIGTIGATLGGAALTPGSPWVGALLGAGLNKTSPFLMKALQKMIGRKQ